MFAMLAGYKVAILAVLGAVLIAGSYMFGHHVESLAFDAYRSKIQAESAATIAAAQAHASEVQITADEQQAATIAAYEAKLHENDQTAAAIRSADVSGSNRMWVPTTPCRSGAGSSIAARAVGAHASPGTYAKLPPAFGFSVLSVGTDADAAVADRDAQIAGLQARVRQDMIEINGSYSEEGGTP